ncbi:AAA domain-containing protein [Rhodobacterales bacterium HKCCE3408]|nr:AAA domain-containing protein [Rhodobacterales bacterium HKCCE3408]
MQRAPSVSAAHPATPWLGLSRKDCFFEDDATRALLARAADYVRAGVCVNLSGAAGLGKTTLALRIAEEIGRPVSLMTGNEWLTTRDFVGREVGQTERTVVDKYVQSVRRTETESRADWRSAILAVSMTRGYTLVYDEFTRASPEANSALLSVLEEGILVATDRASDRSYIAAHPDFRIILTSNPHDYAGVKSAPDALMDRVVTIPLEEPPADRLAGIVALRTGIDPETAGRIARLVLGLPAGPGDRGPGVSALRSAVLIGRIAAHRVRSGALDDADLATIARDVLAGRGIAADPGRIATLLSPATPENRR